MLTEILFCALLMFSFYKWANANGDYFAKRKLKYLKPKFLVGNTIGLFMNQYTPGGFMDMIYYKYPQEKLIGYFDMRKPIYLARDPDFIHQIAIKHFDSFEDHVALVNSESDSLFGKSLLMLEGKNWRDMRATLSPAFTGSKMRHMFELIADCADNMAQYLNEELKQDKTVRWEIKKFISRYTSDVIASCAFGLKTNSLSDPSNEFFRLGIGPLKLSSLSFSLRALAIHLLPTLMRSIDFELFPANVRQFFKSVVIDTMVEREKRNVKRPDMINLLMQARTGKIQYDKSNSDDADFATVKESNIGRIQVKRTWSDDEIVAQCFDFFSAGFDTSSDLMSFICYELAINQDIQNKLYAEICAINEELNGCRLTYDALSKMKYLDQIISEGLRKWPPVQFTDRKCTKDFTFELDGKKILIEKNKQISIPIYSIQNDPEIFENPETFDPERFNEENKRKIKPGTFIPFGIGPRNCIASRFALMEIKALFFYLFLNFNIQPYEDTQIPVKIANSTLGWITEKGIHLEFRLRV